MKKLIILPIVLMTLCLNAQQKAKYSTFPSQDVQLLPGIFKDAQTVDMKYILALDPDRLLAPFLREAGLPTKAENYPNWENTGLDGHIGGHYVSALSLMYASTGDKKVFEKLNYMLDTWEKCQNANGDGYIGGVPGSKKLWADIAAGKIAAGGFDLNKTWVPLYNIHKTYSGLHDAFVYAKSEKAKKMLVKFSDWMLNLTKNLDDKQVQTMLRSEHGGLNESFADVAAITGDKKYMQLAYRFSHQTILEPLEHQVDKLNGMHANTQIPKVIGFERIAQLNNDSAYGRAASFFWDNVVNSRSSAIGGNSVREHFHPINDFSSMMTSEQGPETCNTYNMLKLSKMLFQFDGNEKYIEYYERALYNHILSTQHPDKGGFVYFTPMRPGHYRVYSQPQTSFWCCVGSGMENHGKYNELIYAYNKTNVFVNLFIPSRLDWKAQNVVITQTTRFPDEENVTLRVNTPRASKFTLNVRYPAWVAANALKVTINDETVAVTALPGSYVGINRKWKDGDKVVVHLPMRTTVEELPDKSNYVAVLHGPIVLAAKTDTAEMKGLFADDSRGGHVASGRQFPINEMPMFVADKKAVATNIKAVPGKTLTFTASDLIYQDKYKKLELIPFFRLHDSRYIIYWPTETPERISEMQKKSAADEASRQQLAASTLDLITPGEQQPESDHFIESESSNTGVNMDRHWRDATGWFSYKMKDAGKQAGSLQVTYCSKDKGRKFKIQVNNQTIADVALTGSESGNFYPVVYVLPEALVKQSNGILTVKFIAEKGSVAGGVYEVRLLKK